MNEPLSLPPVARLTAMRMDDLVEVDRIERQSFLSPWSANVYQRELERNPFSYYKVIRPTPDGERMGLPPILGYGGCWVMDDAAHILTIASRPDQRRRRLGEWLLLGLLSDAVDRAAAQATLEVRVSNLPAIALYKKLGFEESGLRKGYYPPAQDLGREDALLLTLSDLDDVNRQIELADQLQTVSAAAQKALSRGLGQS
jgi:ribosomal-protein-alanine N-acetyltransferase